MIKSKYNPQELLMQTVILQVDDRTYDKYLKNINSGLEHYE
jgi:hypothetical protein